MPMKMMDRETMTVMHQHNAVAVTIEPLDLIVILALPFKVLALLALSKGGIVYVLLLSYLRCHHCHDICVCVVVSVLCISTTESAGRPVNDGK